MTNSTTCHPQESLVSASYRGYLMQHLTTWYCFPNPGESTNYSQTAAETTISTVPPFSTPSPELGKHEKMHAEIGVGSKWCFFAVSSEKTMQLLRVVKRDHYLEIPCNTLVFYLILLTIQIQAACSTWELKGLLRLR